MKRSGFGVQWMRKAGVGWIPLSMFLTKSVPQIKLDNDEKIMTIDQQGRTIKCLCGTYLREADWSKLIQHLCSYGHIGGGHHKCTGWLNTRGARLQGNAVDAWRRSAAYYANLPDLIKQFSAVAMCGQGSHAFSAGKLAMLILQKVLSTLHAGPISELELGAATNVAPGLAELGKAFNACQNIVRPGGPPRDGVNANEQLAMVTHSKTVRAQIVKVAEDAQRRLYKFFDGCHKLGFCFDETTGQSIAGIQWFGV